MGGLGDEIVPKTRGYWSAVAFQGKILLNLIEPVERVQGAHGEFGIGGVD